MLVVASMVLCAKIYLEVTCRISEKDRIALTFDDGPHPKYTPELLDVLAKHNAKATFFVVGKNAKKHPEIIRRMIEEGHSVGNHSYSHQWQWGFWSEDKVYRELRGTRELLNEIHSQSYPLFRPPFGISNPNIAKVVKRMELAVVGWSLRTFDTSRKPKKVQQQLLKKLKGGDIVLMHDRLENTPQVIDIVLTHFSKSGLKFVNLEAPKSDTKLD